MQQIVLAALLISVVITSCKSKEDKQQEAECRDFYKLTVLDKYRFPNMDDRKIQREYFRLSNDSSYAAGREYIKWYMFQIQNGYTPEPIGGIVYEEHPAPFVNLNKK